MILVFKLGFVHISCSSIISKLFIDIENWKNFTYPMMFLHFCNYIFKV